MKIKLIPLFGLLLLLSFCKKDEALQADSFVFGSAYGFCVGDCATFFLIESNKLYPDSIEKYYNDFLRFKKNPLSDDNYILAKTLMNNFPKYLGDNPNKTFGCPDCADQGGIHIQVTNDGETKTWHLDTDISNLPAEIRNYVQNVKAIIQQL